MIIVRLLSPTWGVMVWILTFSHCIKVDVLLFTICMFRQCLHQLFCWFNSNWLIQYRGLLTYRSFMMGVWLFAKYNLYASYSLRHVCGLRFRLFLSRWLYLLIHRRMDITAKVSPKCASRGNQQTNRKTWESYNNINNNDNNQHLPWTRIADLSCI